MTQCRKHNKTMDKIRELFESEIDVSYQDIAERCHIDLRNAREYTKILHGNGDIHICGYLPYSIPIFRNGTGIDAKKPSRRQRECARVKDYRVRRNAKAVFVQASRAKSITGFMLSL